jgi:hypothetical protein
MTKVAVIKKNLLYRLPDVNKGRSFIPEVGEILDLPDEIAQVEIESKNVRLALKEETVDLTLETNKFESDNEEVIIREEKKFKKKKKHEKS